MLQEGRRHEIDKNNFKNYTIIHALYCSGDVWGGNTTRLYNDSSGVPIQQVGYLNAQATLDWVLDQQTKGNLASTLSSLIVMGCSAGSIGAQIWGKAIVETLPHESSAIGILSLKSFV